MTDAPTIIDRWLVPFQAGDFAGAWALLDAALAETPDDPEIWRACVLHSDYDPHTTAAHQLATRRSYAARLPTRPHGPIRDPDPERPLRIGYVSGDYRFHSAGFSMEPALRHDPPAVLYASGPVDQLTGYFYRDAAHWRGGCDWVSAEALAAQIRRDQIDVLVCLGGHTDGGRLDVFALRPAPVQVVAWGYATTTGLPAMDAFFTDPYQCPPEYQGKYITEQPVYLPALLSHDPAAAYPPPAPRKPGPIRFGYFGSPAKINNDCLKMWVQLLQAVPDSTLTFGYGGFEDKARQDRITLQCILQGVSGLRLHFGGSVPQPQHLARVAQVDIALDSYPHGGGVTTLEALLSGVPVLTRRGEMLPSRVAGALLQTLNYDAWITESAEEFVKRGVAFAQPERLILHRRMLPGWVRFSEICDLAGYQRAVESAYRTLWRQALERERHAGLAPSAVPTTTGGGAPARYGGTLPVVSSPQCVRAGPAEPLGVLGVRAPLGDVVGGQHGADAGATPGA